MLWLTHSNLLHTLVDLANWWQSIRIITNSFTVTVVGFVGRTETHVAVPLVDGVDRKRTAPDTGLLAVRNAQIPRGCSPQLTTTHLGNLS